MRSNTSSDLITPDGFTLYLVTAIQIEDAFYSYVAHKTTSFSWDSGWGILFYGSSLRFFVNQASGTPFPYVNLPFTDTTNGQPHIIKMRYDKNNIEAEVIGPVDNLSGSTAYSDSVIDSGDSIWLSYETNVFHNISRRW